MIEKTLSERSVYFYQLPRELQLSFGADTNQLSPVRPITRSYLPMVFQILPPKTKVDTTSALNYNTGLESAQHNPNFKGSRLSSSDMIFQSMSDLQFTLDTLKFIQPLVLYINPSDLTRSMTKKVQEQFAGYGHIVEHYGDDQDKLSANGKIGAFYTDKTGVTRYYRRNSASYQQLMYLLTIYRNNGYIYEADDKSRISLVGSVQITYDTETWIGHFDSLSITESADAPFTLEYSFEFTAKEYSNDPSLT
jgi:hypothetical protein